MGPGYNSWSLFPNSNLDWHRGIIILAHLMRSTMAREKDNQNISLFFSLVSSLIVFMFLSQVFSSYIIKPLTYDGTLVRSGRYSFSFEAWDTISEVEETTIVAMGSSLTQYGINGSCITVGNDDRDSKTFNLGIPGSYPYLDMMQTERAVNSNPDLILLEINPISLSKVSGIPNENIQLRFTLGSLHLKPSDYGKWLDIVRQSDRDYIDGLFQNRYNSESMYFDDSLEELLNRYRTQNSEGEWWEIDRHWYLSTPHPESEEWDEYLLEPTLLNGYLSKLSIEELQKYENETIPTLMMRDRYKPNLISNLNYDALDHMVSRFTNSGISVVLVSYPIHPIAMQSLEPGQLDDHNSSISRLLSYDKTSSLNFLWNHNLNQDDFYDYEHIGEAGRQKMCTMISQELSELIHLSH